MRIQFIIMAILSIAIPVLASVSVSDVTPEKLSKGDVAYVLSVFCFFEAIVICTLYMTHRKDWNERDKADREDRKANRDEIRNIIAKCGK